MRGGSQTGAEAEFSGSSRVLALLVGLAIGLRALAWSRTVVLFNDGPIFLKIAEAIGDGRWQAVISHPYHPLYALLISGAASLGLDPESAAVWISILGGGLAVGALYVFLCDTFGPRHAVLGAAALALHPHAVTFSSDIQSDGLYLGLFLVGVALLWRSLARQRPGLAILAGLFSGLAYLTRPEGLGVVLVGGGAAVALWAASRWSAKSAAAWLAALAIGAGIAVTPYVVAIHDVTGVWTLTLKKQVLQLGEPRAPARIRSEPGAAPGPAQPSQPALPVAVTAVQPVDGGAVRKAAFGVRELVGAVASTIRFELLPFLLLGIYTLRGRPGPRGLYVGAFAALYALVLLALAMGAGYISRRHALPPVALGFGYLAVGLDRVTGWVAVHFSRRRATESALALGLAVALLVVLALPRDLRARRIERAARREAAEWLRAQPTEQGAVAAGRLQVAYYADRSFVALPAPGQPDALGYLQRSPARYLILDEERLRAEPALARARGNELELLHSVEAGGRSAMVFRILRPGEAATDAASGAAERGS